MSDEASPTFGLQAAGSTPPAQADVQEIDIDVQGNSAEASMEDNARTYADGKFSSVEDLEKSYQELQKLMGNKSNEEPPTTLEDVVEAAGLKFDELITNYNTDGRLSDTEYEALGKQNFSRQMIDEFLMGKKAQLDNGQYAVDQMRSNSENIVGGKEQLDGLLDWFGKKYSTDQSHLDRTNEMLHDPNTYRMAIQSMYFEYQQETGRGSETQLIQGDRMPDTSTGFTNVEDLVSAMAKVRDAGRLDEATKRRLMNTPKHIMQGIE
tara:strand:- start:1975 stop:2769 length:795 start_codon:yes stop_codon:yes gene_type:complete